MPKFKVYINNEHFNYMIDLIHKYDHERFAVLMGNVETVTNKKSIVIKEMQILDDNDYDGLHTTLCVPKKSVINDLMDHLKIKKYSVYIEYHTHPFNFPRFSSTDIQDEINMWKYFHNRFPNKYYGNMVIDKNYMGQSVIRDWHSGKLVSFEPIAYKTSAKNLNIINFDIKIFIFNISLYFIYIILVQNFLLLNFHFLLVPIYLFSFPLYLIYLYILLKA